MSISAVSTAEGSTRSQLTRYRIRRWPIGDPQGVVDAITPRTRIGRASDNDLVVDDPTVCPHHCTLSLRGGTLWLDDAGSERGTWVDGVRIDRVALAPPVRLRIGNVGLHVGSGVDRSAPHGIVGAHPKMLRVFDLIDRFGPLETPVLIAGESGTGKELVARALHRSSCRHRGPFEAINCSAIPRELAESELFGHQRGAFTGATHAYAGALARADGGTLFLDEIGEMPPEVQPKLLRALEDGRVKAVGADHSRAVSVRVIAATHRDLERAVERGEFRLDLYHRLAVGLIRVPALRERVEDIPLLSRHFLEQWRREDGLAVKLDPQMEQRLKTLPWPGNVRALRNALWRAVVLGCGALDLEQLVPRFDEEVRESCQGYVRFEGRLFAELKREVFTRVVQSHGGNRSAAAAALGIPKSTFFDQLRAMKL